MSENHDLSGNGTRSIEARGVTMHQRREFLRERVRRHVDHLDALVQTLRTLGVSDGAINSHVAEIFEQYKAQLLRNIDRT